MRQIKTYSHPNMSITVFEWNGNYILRYVVPFAEQTFKVSKMDLIQGESAMDQVVEGPLTQQAYDRFLAMRDDCQQVLEPLL